MSTPAEPSSRRRRAWWLLLACLVGACGAGPAASSSASTPALTVQVPATAQSSPAVSSSASVSPGSSFDPIVASPSASPAAGPSNSPGVSPDPTATVSPAPQTPFTLDLFRRGDFVSQARSDWCVPASILMMARIIDRSAARSVPNQRVLDRRARALSSPRLVGAGSEPQGWAGVLNRLGFGPYEVASFPTRAAALRAAARAIRSTGRPVGLLMWHGAHAWVMSGFTATADPALTDTFRVTGVRVSDPWYPRPTSAFGRTRPPDTRLSVAQLAAGFLRWHRPLVSYAELDGRFVLVLPVPGPSATG